MAKSGSRKKLPKEVAVINADNCTGCEACLEVCPVDCIYKVQGETIPVLQSWCEIDVERCVGCEVCVHVPTKKSDPYELTVCPWDAIEMVPTVEVSTGRRQQRGPARLHGEALGAPRHSRAADGGTRRVVTVHESIALSRTADRSGLGRHVD